MKHRIFFVVGLVMSCCSVAAAYTTLAVGPLTVQGAVVTVPITLGNSNGLNNEVTSLDAVLGFDSLTLSGSVTEAVTAGSAIGDKTIKPSLLRDGVIRCLVSSFSLSVIPDNQTVASIAFTHPPGVSPSIFMISGLKIEATTAAGNTAIVFERRYAESDALRLLGASLGGVSLTAMEKSGADLNNDGKIDIGDAVMAMAHVAGV